MERGRRPAYDTQCGHSAPGWVDKNRMTETGGFPLSLESETVFCFKTFFLFSRLLITQILLAPF